jgi:hypothetical protein
MAYEAYHLNVGIETLEYEGILSANAAYTVQLIRDGTVLEEIEGETDATGYYSGSFDNAFILTPGDLITSSDGFHPQAVTVQGFFAVLSAEADRLVGTVAASQPLRVEFSQENLPTTCSPQAKCFSLAADSNGNFGLDIGANVNPGDQAKIFLYDPSGNGLFTYRYAPTLVIDTRGWGWFYGYWSHPNANLTITYLDPNGNPVGGCGTKFSLDGHIWCSSFPYGFDAGDTIVVTDNDTGESRSVLFPAYDSAELDNIQQIARGVAHSADAAIVNIFDYRPLTNVTTTYCRQAVVSGEQYSFSTADIPAGAEDSLDGWHRQTSGNYIVGETHAFLVQTVMGESMISGYTLGSYEHYTIDIYVGDVLTKTVTDDSDGNGRFYTYIGPLTITPGMRLEVRVSGVLYASISVPELSAFTDEVNGSIYGWAFPNSTVQARLYNIEEWTFKNGMFSGVDEYIPAGVQTEASGFYSAVIPHHLIQCSVPVGRVTPMHAPGVAYYTPEEHSITKRSNPAYLPTREPDDTAETAQLYSGPSSHTIHQKRLRLYSLRRYRSGPG